MRLHAALLLFIPPLLRADPQFGRILDRLGIGAGSTLTNDKIAAGLKEALQIGAGNAVGLTGRKDGFYGNAIIRIPMPDKLRNLEKGLRMAGLGKKVDEFELSMNRAAEAAAPQAKTILLDAIRGMTLDDGRRILTGGDTAATAYFKEKTSASIAAAFRPVVEKAIADVGVTRQYQQLTRALPFAKLDAFDLNAYVVSKSLDGLFHMLGEEERRIRADPAARVTALLREVFKK
jgi:hypothetical protein